MNTVLIAAGFILMFNPSLNVFDFLPDFLGWIFIFCALKKVRRLSLKMDSAASYMLKMVWLTAARFVSAVLLPYMDGTMTLTVTFVFDVLELVWGLPAFKSLFGGLEELSQFYGGKSIYNPASSFKGEGIQTVRKITYIFLVIKSVFNAVPEFLELSGQSSVIESASRTILSYKPMFYIVSFTAVTVAGIVWLVIAVPFILRIGKEKDFTAKIKNAYDIKVVETGIHRASELSGALFYVTVSGLFMFEIMLDSINIVPRFVIPIILLIAFSKVSSAGYNMRPAVISGIVSTAISVLSYTMQWIFILKYGYFSTTRSFEAYYFYTFTFACVLAEMAAFIVMQIIWARTLIKISEKDTVPDTLNDAKMISMNNAEIKKLKRRIIINTVLFAADAAVTAAAFAVVYEFPYIWLVLVLVNLVWFVSSYTLYSGIREKIEYKYMI